MSDQVSFDDDDARDFIGTVRPGVDALDLRVRPSDLQNQLLQYVDAGSFRLHDYFTEARANITFVSSVIQAMNGIPQLFTDPTTGAVFSIPTINGQLDYSGLTDEQVRIALDQRSLDLSQRFGLANGPRVQTVTVPMTGEQFTIYFVDGVPNYDTLTNEQRRIALEVGDARILNFNESMSIFQQTAPGTWGTVQLQQGEPGEPFGPLTRLEYLNQKIENWTGSDNDPILDQLIRERNELSEPSPLDSDFFNPWRAIQVVEPRSVHIPPAVEHGANSTHAVSSIDPIPGAGQVQINLYIPDDEVSSLILPVYGDDRGPDPEATLENSRAILLIDFETGDVAAAFSASCRPHYHPFSGGGTVCDDAFPTSIVLSDSPESDQIDGDNGFVIVQDGNEITVAVQGKISVGPPGSPSINGTVTIAVDEDGNVEADKQGDGFPAYEIYQDIDDERIPVDQFEAGWPHQLFGDGEGIG